MRKVFFITGLACLLILTACKPHEPTARIEETVADTFRQAWAIVIHGGAGDMAAEHMSPALEKEYRATLAAALSEGKITLQQGGYALDAVERTIRTLEDSPLFNAGKGAVFTHEGKNELDASIMDGSNLKAGAVAGVTDIKNPISAARAVMENSPHVLLSGAGASEFAREQGLEIVPPSYFFTQQRWKNLQDILKKEKHGTVGCCALDVHGNLAAGTSTGGMDNKRYNRIGDSPVIGAGTYANNVTCAISCTGHGEYFIRYTVAHDVSALMEYRGLSLAAAADTVVNGKLLRAGGKGGLIGVDRKGNIAMTFNTNAMFRAWAVSRGSTGIEIFQKQ
jgi:beta-aspartyl-peptidase (threonine type)